MKKLKPVYISILTIVFFVVAMLIGVNSEWWITEGRKTPLDGASGNDHDIEMTEEYIEEEHSDEEDHESTQISGGSTVQSAIDLGIQLEDIEDVLKGTIEDKNELIKTIVTERGLKFGEVKDNLNALINN